MMLPRGGIIENRQIQVIQQPSRTYRMDFPSNRIIGMTDGLDAVKQAVFKILQTERFYHPIYSTNYGVELGSLIGSEPAFVRSELKRRLTEALLQDDRIMAVENLEFEIYGDSAVVCFSVVSQYGSFDVSEEVRWDVRASEL